MCINPCFSRLSIQFSKTVLAVQWILNQLESSINLHFWDLTIWSSDSNSYSRLFEQSSHLYFLVWYFQVKFNNSPRFNSQDSKYVSINQFVCVFIYIVVSLRQAGKYLYYILWIHGAWYLMFRLLFVLQSNWLRLFS